MKLFRKIKTMTNFTWICQLEEATRKQLSKRMFQTLEIEKKVYSKLRAMNKIRRTIMMIMIKCLKL
jgi:hypothetical protein